MKLYYVERTKPNYDETIAVVVRAKSHKHARALAAAALANREYSCEFLSMELATCKPLTISGPAKVLITHDLCG